MGTIALQNLVLGNPNSSEAPKIISNFAAIANAINGGLDASNIVPAILQSAGVNGPSTVKGYNAVSTSQSTGSTTYTTLSTPDQVTGITLPAGGLIAVWYQAMWSNSPAASGSHAGIFLGANQLKDTQVVSPAVNEALGDLNYTVAGPLFTNASGLTSLSSSGGSAYTGDVTTGQAITRLPHLRGSWHLHGQRPVQGVFRDRDREQPAALGGSEVVRLDAC